MTLRDRTRATLLAAALALPIPALAQAPAPNTPAGASAPAISMDEARRIANENGMVRIEEISLDDGKWEIEGRDAAGAEIEIDLRATDGTVIKMERDRPAAAGVRP